MLEELNKQKSINQEKVDSLFYQLTRIVVLHQFKSLEAENVWYQNVT